MTWGPAILFLASLLLQFIVFFMLVGRRCRRVRNLPDSLKTQKDRKREDLVRRILMVTSFFNYIINVFVISTNILCTAYDCTANLLALKEIKEFTCDANWAAIVFYWVLPYLFILIETAISNDAKCLQPDRRFTWQHYEEEMEGIKNEEPCMKAIVECFKRTHAFDYTIWIGIIPIFGKAYHTGTCFFNLLKKKSDACTTGDTVHCMWFA